LSLAMAAPLVLALREALRPTTARCPTSTLVLGRVHHTGH